MTEPKYLIWSNYSLDYEDWREDLEAEYPELSEQEREEKMYERNGEYLDDERMNLDIQLDKPILVIVDLGLWNGRYSGYKEIKSGNIKDCLFSECDYVTWYVDRLGDMRCDAVHHDGTVKSNSDSELGMRLVAYLPELHCAVDIAGATVTEKREQSVKAHICQSNRLGYYLIKRTADASQMAAEIKTLFIRNHIYLHTDSEKDVQVLRERFLEWKYRNACKLNGKY